MSRIRFAAFITFCLLYSSVSFASSIYDIHVFVDKPAYGPGEAIVMYGFVQNRTSNSTANMTSYVENSTIRLAVLNSTNGTVSNYTLSTNDNGTFYSNSTYYSNGVAVSAPNS